MKWTRNNKDLFLRALEDEKPKNQNKKPKQRSLVLTPFLVAVIEHLTNDLGKKGWFGLMIEEDTSIEDKLSASNT